MSTLLRLLFATNAVLACVLALAWWAGPATWKPPAPLPPDAQSIEAVAIAPLAQAGGWPSAMAERPLFEPGRRPPSSDAGPDAAGVAQPKAGLDFALLGIVRSAGGGRAMVRVDGQVRRLRPGERAGPWTLQALGENSARFLDDAGEEHELTLRRARGTPAPEGQAAAPADAQAAGEGDALEDPITHKSFEQRVAERRAYREALQQRLGESP